MLNTKKNIGLSLTTFAPHKISVGFTLVETLLAIALLSMAIVAPLTIASSGVTAATTGKDRLIAISLARDAIEHIRSIRDRNRLQQVPADKWLTGISPVNESACTDSLGCRVDSLWEGTGNETKKINTQAESLLQYDTSSGLYSYRSGGTWSPSKYYRWYVIEDIVPNREVRITVTVSWRTIYAGKTIVLIDQLTNW